MATKVVSKALETVAPSIKRLHVCSVSRFINPFKEQTNPFASTEYVDALRAAKDEQLWRLNKNLRCTNVASLLTPGRHTTKPSKVARLLFLNYEMPGEEMMHHQYGNFPVGNPKKIDLVGNYNPKQAEIDPYTGLRKVMKHPSWFMGGPYKVNIPERPEPSTSSAAVTGFHAGLTAFLKMEKRVESKSKQVTWAPERPAKTMR